MTALIAVAHGSRDPRSGASIRRAVDVLRRRRPDLDVRVAFLDLTDPGVDTVVDELASSGHTRIVAVPLLLGSAYHAKVDLPALLNAARARHPHLSIAQSDVLGGDRLLVDAVRDRVVQTGVALDDTTVGVALAAVGSNDASANERTELLAQDLVSGSSWAGAVACFATSVEPSATEAVAQLRSMGAARIVVAPWFLAPGRLTDRVTRLLLEHPDVTFAEVIGSHPAVAEIASRRYDAALQRSSRHRTA